MKMMDKMMESVLEKMSAKKKQKMIIDMMPMMMKDVNMAETMVDMVPLIISQITLLDLLTELKKVFPTILDSVNTITDLISKWDELSPKMFEKFPDFLETIFPAIELLMPMVMTKIMPVMAKEENLKLMESLHDRMAEKVFVKKELIEAMPKIMSTMIPHCIEKNLPHMKSDDKKEFLQTLKEIINQENEKE